MEGLRITEEFARLCELYKQYVKNAHNIRTEQEEAATHETVKYFSSSLVYLLQWAQNHSSEKVLEFVPFLEDALERYTFTQQHEVDTDLCIIGLLSDPSLLAADVLTEDLFTFYCFRMLILNYDDMVFDTTFRTKMKELKAVVKEIICAQFEVGSVDSFIESVRDTTTFLHLVGIKAISHAALRTPSLAFSQNKEDDDCEEGEDSAKTIEDCIESSTLLCQFGCNLVAEAHKGALDKLVGRESEMKVLLSILQRRRKANAILVGEAGTGKTAIVEGLANLIAEDAPELPEMFRGCTIYSLDVGKLVAGTKYRGDFENRFTSIMTELEKLDKVIVFIDEVHLILNAGATEEAKTGAGSLLKPLLARGGLRFIGATTNAEYRQSIFKDKALNRRFQEITIDTPGLNEILDIVSGSAEGYESFHSVTISPDVVASAVKLSDRFLVDLPMPDKAFDVLDDACVLARGDGRDTVSVEDIENVIVSRTGIDVKSTDIKGLGEKLHSAIKGQDDACAKVLASVKRAKVGLTGEDKPLASFMFAGPTGVGKTELCKALSRGLFGTDKALLRIDMSEFMEKSAVSRLLGTTAGFVGYSDGAPILEQIRSHPYSVVLFDEIEKAHPDVLNLLLQVLDTGTLTDGQSNSIDFRNTIVVLTTNVGGVVPDGASLNGRTVGFSSILGVPDESNFNVTTIPHTIKSHFKPELLNRLDEIIVFNKLSQDVVHDIVELQLEQLVARLENIGTTLEVMPEVADLITKAIDFSEYGARELRRFIIRNVDVVVADALLEYGNARTLVLSVEGDKFIAECKQLVNQ